MKRREFLVLAAAGAAASSVRAQSGADLEPFSFCVIADPHGSEAAKPELERYGTAADKFMRCFGVMAEMKGGDAPDFCLVAGDIQLDGLKDRLKDVSTPLHMVAGNHESTPEKRQMLRNAFPGDFKKDGKESDYYSFIHKGVRFIAVCDAGAGGEHVGQFCSENIRPSGQCEWLEGELSAREPVKILFAHIPPERGGGDQNMFMSRNDSRWFNRLIAETRPSACFFGHLHQPTLEYRIGDTRMFQVRSCCWNFNREPVGFLHVSVAAGGVLTVREIETGRCL